MSKQVMSEQLICDVCEQPARYTEYDNMPKHVIAAFDIAAFDHPARPREAVPFPAGSKALWIDGVEVTILAADGVQRWAKWPDGVVCTVDIDSLRPIPTKIAEPPVGSVVWDGDVPFIHDFLTGKSWIAFIDGEYVRRTWSDMPDTVVLATPPGGDR